MSVTEAVVIALAGLWAGTINTVVGSGTLVTFPVLLFFGYNPLVANISNNIGLVGGGVTGAWGYRRELAGARQMLLRLAPMSLVGAVIGALLLRVLPPGAFEAIVPVLIGIGLLLVIFGPRLQRLAAARRPEGQESAGGGRVAALTIGVLLAGVYGGYFGAAQGVILMGLLSTLTVEAIQRLNGVKNVLGLVVNAVAAVVFLVVAHELVDWAVVGLITAGSLAGGVLGARVGRRLPPNALRAVIVVVGVVGIVRILTT